MAGSAPPLELAVTVTPAPLLEPSPALSAPALEPV
jgi:hypothetical protein